MSFKWIEGVHYESFPKDKDGMKYRALVDLYHHGKKHKVKTIPKHRRSDGATLAKDLCPEAFFTHDEFCIAPWWDGGTPISNLQASIVYFGILKRYGHRIRGSVRLLATCLFGGGRIKKRNGWFFSWKR